MALEFSKPKYSLPGLAQQFIDPVDIKATMIPQQPITLYSPEDTMKQLPTEQGQVVKPVGSEGGLAQQTAGGLPTDIGKYKEMWSQMYQTTNDPTKEAAYMEHVKNLYGKAPKEAEIRAAIGQSLPAFAGEVQSRGMTPKAMEELLYRTALHESMGGKYNKQIEGPARSWWQVEPDTAYDNIKNYGHALGSGFEKAVGYSKDKLQSMSKDQVANLLEKDPNFAASMAALWYLRKMPKS